MLLNLGSTVFGTEQLRNFLVERVLTLLPGMHSFVKQNIEAVTNVSSGVVLTCLFMFIWAGSWIFRVIEKAFSRIWHTGCRSFVEGRLITVFVTTSVGFTLLLSSVLFSSITLLQGIFDRLSETQRLHRPIPHWVLMLTGYFWQISFGVIALLVTVTLFIIIYRFLPNTRVTLREAFPGALIAGILWELAKYIFAWMLPYFHYEMVYGSIGAGIALLSWIYISSLIMLFGAQITGVLYVEDHSITNYDDVD